MYCNCYNQYNHSLQNRVNIVILNEDMLTHTASKQANKRWRLHSLVRDRISYCCAIAKRIAIICDYKELNKTRFLTKPKFTCRFQIK